MMNRSIITILLLLFSKDFFCYSQNQNKIDSLKNILFTLNEDTSKIGTMISLASSMVTVNTDSAFIYGNKAKELADKTGNEKFLAYALGALGDLYKHIGEYDTALIYFSQSLEIENRIRNLPNIAKCNINIGVLYKNKGNYPLSLDYSLKALKIDEKLNAEPELAGDYNAIGIIYDLLDKKDMALDYHFKSLKIREKIGDKRGMASSYNNIGVIYDGKKNNELALDYYNKTLSICEELNIKFGIAFSYTNIGSVYYNLGELDKSLAFHLKSLKLSEELGIKTSVANCFNNLGVVYRAKKDNKNAKAYLEKGIGAAREINHKNYIISGLEQLSGVFADAGDFKNAFNCQNEYTTIKDSLLNEKSSRQIAEMQTKYETEKKELQIENLNKDNAIKETEIKKQNLQKIAFASGFGLMLSLAFVVFRGYRQKQKAHLIISMQKEEVEKQKLIVDEKNKTLEIAYTHIEEKNHEILDSIRYAKRIQEAILPPQKLVTSYLENSFILYKPKDIVAGDFYWMHPISTSPLEKGPGSEVLFAVVDCTGHGVPGAFVSILGHNCLNRCVKEFGLTQPAAILDKLCELIDEAFSKSETDIKDGMDIALCALEFIPHPKSYTQGCADDTPISFGEGLGVRLQYAGAGNALYHIRNGVLSELTADKQPVGKFAFRKPFTNHTIQLQTNDSIYIFTDGYADQFGGPKGKKFKYRQFENLLIAIQNKSMSKQREILNETIEHWRGEMDQVDDICIIGMRC